jgi:nucleoid-associated protein YgaU
MTMKKLLFLGLIFALLVPAISFAQEKLTEKQAQDELIAVKEKVAQAEAKIQELQAKVDALKSEIANLEAKRDELKAKIVELKEAWKRCQYGRYKVVEGDWLSKIAGMRTIYSDGKKWPSIFEVNKDKIKDPNLIYPNWVLLIPNYEQYTVNPGDCLWMIASYISVYTDAKKWPQIYEANKDKIKDPDLIYPKQDFVVPQE